MFRLKVKKKYFIICLFFIKTGFCSNLLTQPHFNSLIIIRNSEFNINFNFEVNLSVAMHQLLEPKLSHEEFLKKYTLLSNEKFDQAMQYFIQDLYSKCFLVTAQDKRYKLIKWELPNNLQVKKLLLDELSIINVPEEFQVHIDPINLKAEVQSVEPIHRIKLSLSTSLMPIFVINGDKDKFWLTVDLPLFVINIP